MLLGIVKIYTICFQADKENKLCSISLFFMLSVSNYKKLQYLNLWRPLVEIVHDRTQKFPFIYIFLYERTQYHPYKSAVFIAMISREKHSQYYIDTIHI